MKKKFNVVCVTKYSGRPHTYNNPILWHQDIQGEAVVDTIAGTCLFQEKEYPIEASGTGLNGTCLVIFIRVKDSKIEIVENESGTIDVIANHPLFNFWGLYTDTPATGKETPDCIRESAKRHIKE